MSEAQPEQQRKTEVLTFLHEKVFDPLLNSAKASARLKQGVRYTIMRLNERDADGIIRYYWSAVVGTDKSIAFAQDMRHEGFTRFEDREVLEEFRKRFPLAR
jgi:hypothetical protein